MCTGAWVQVAAYVCMQLCECLVGVGMCVYLCVHECECLHVPLSVGTCVFMCKSVCAHLCVLVGAHT